MSLLEDIADLLRCVLEYFGVPADMLVPVWDSTLCGQYRSIIRMIGTNLLLSPYPRLQFQIPLQTLSRHGHIDVSVDTPVIPTLADVLWLVEDEGDSHTKFRNVIPLRKHCVPQGFEIPSMGSEGQISVSVHAQRGGRLLGQGTQPEALQKISALEEELQRLRAQIAMIVTAPAGTIRSQSGNAVRSPGGTPVRRRRSKGIACSSDPAALIAEALKRKFAHRQREDSFGKENCSAEPSPFSSPDTPKIFHHTRHSQGRIYL
ncbi:mitochondrial fission regulator 2-like [Myxocyprinus asiaticus]|uniref:mitochondrial fission regulator 2-like n=1 Tax=Myxocyprinus asiaticus TaxID=70543 RepID=UPI002221F73B|nr:mitochondrial fission regulator 2-like [Myxocyprinus asiaticus]